MASPASGVPRPCACTTVRTASRRLARLYDVALHERELNVTQLAVLRAVERSEGQPLTQAAGDLSMDRTSLYRAVGTLEGRGWLTLRTGRDRRSRAARLTARGRRVLDEAAPAWEWVQGAVVEAFGRRRWQALVAELADLLQVADDVEARLSGGQAP